MHIFVTTTQADASLPIGWEGDGDKEQAVREANIFLSAQGLSARAKADPTPDAVIQAGAYAAQEAAQGKLFTDSKPEVRKKSVTAGPVTSTKEYAEGSVATSATQQMITALLKPYIQKRNGAQLLGRL